MFDLFEDTLDSVATKRSLNAYFYISDYEKEDVIFMGMVDAKELGGASQQGDGGCGLITM
ncbi:hypothetical protein SM124_11855 [Bacillus sp. 31A1R]|uniref:Uncharacterized protein n=1 Tax=Robertmurraya mangrovi TaxID=3098077 RepID=A0ABU5IZ64_9BACI|nr:hypothetical protein [Bacillus sp. 31A1R]MDZ5472443.1 hypothetical protein [Bacillus sp. 31A1R]